MSRNRHCESVRCHGGECDFCDDVGARGYDGRDRDREAHGDRTPDGVGILQQGIGIFRKEQPPPFHEKTGRPQNTPGLKSQR